MNKLTNPSLLTFESFVKHIKGMIINAGFDFVDINAGEIHRAMGGYPSNNHRMPICCAAMRSLMGPNDIILIQPKKGNGASLTIRYHVSRNR